MIRPLAILLLLLVGGCEALDRAVSVPGEQRREERRAVQPPPPPPPFDYGQYRSVTDCLNAAARARAELSPCERRPLPVQRRR
jgi:hypothetical protein